MMQKETEIRGLPTRWLQTSTGAAQAKNPILLFLHGCPDSPEIWRHQIHAFETDYEIIAPFARGLNNEGPNTPGTRFDSGSVALDHLQVLREADPLGRRSVVVIGHDIGAVHAWELAHMLGPRLAGLVIIDGPSLHQMKDRRFNPRQLIKSWYIGFFQIPLLPQLVLKRTKLGRAVIPFLPYYRRLTRNPRALPRAKQNPIEAPVLVIWGKDDPYLEVPTKKENEKLALNIEMRVLDTGHWPQRDMPAQVNRLLLEFFKKL